MTMNEACMIVFQECKDEYARSYANAWLCGDVQADAKHYGIPENEAAQTQALYILSNIERWRGPSAKEVRQALKEISHG